MRTLLALLLCAADVAALPVVLRGQDRPHAPGRLPARGAADVAALPVVLPGAPRSRPVTREALPAPWCCRSRSAPRFRPRGAADVLRCRPVADVLPVVLPGQDRPPRSRPVVLPTYRAAGQLFYMPRFRRFSGALPALPFHLLDSPILVSALCRRVNRYNPTHFHYFYDIVCCFRVWQAAICP